MIIMRPYDHSAIWSTTILPFYKHSCNFIMKRSVVPTGIAAIFSEIHLDLW